MTYPAPPLDGLGLFHYASIILLISQFYRLFIGKQPLDNYSYVAVLALSADMSCFGLWYFGLTRPWDGSFPAFVLLAFAPVPLAVATLWIATTYWPVQKGTFVCELLTQKNPYGNAIFTAFLSILVLVGYFFVFDKFAEGAACGLPKCQAYAWAIGSPQYSYGAVTAFALATSCFWTSFALLIKGANSKYSD